MKAVLRLLYTYFAGTLTHRILSAVGLMVTIATYVLLRTQPQSTLLGAMAFLGAVSFYLGSSMMPLTFGRMARAQLSNLLPGGRVKLLVSALITVLLVALPMPVTLVSGLLVAIGPYGHPTPEQIAQFHRAIIETFWTTYSVVIVFCAWLYVALWFITSKRNTWGFLQGLIVIAVVLVAPTRNIVLPNSLMWWDLTQCAVTLASFAVLFLLWPRLRLLGQHWGLGTGSRDWPGKRSRVRGREVDLLLGTSNPWLLAVGQLVPVLLATRIGYYSASVWLFYLTIFSTVAGAIAGRAAERSRVLWLRGEWSTVQLFSRVERSFWRHNVCVLGILVILMVVIGRYRDLPVVLLATGLPLLVLGTVLSTYLGLMLTRGLRLAESVLAVAVMLALMAVAVLAARNADDLLTIVLLECGLAVMALALRYAARNRWAHIDWMQCRVDRALIGRSAA
ncbi:MAG TPA: hypothetical protein VGV09_09610 [Steroidobacteraceae bacterium]|nr:hypothetical protein [Steroidobacteraceae bacterium]